MGYYELTATPASIFLGREDVSTATGNSGVTRVEVGFSQVADPGDPITATLPSSWHVVTLDSPDETLSYWEARYIPLAQSLYRFYSRATDVATNREDAEEAWYDGAFVADGTAPIVNWTLPNNEAVLSTPLELRARVSDYAAGEFSVEDTYFVIDGNEVDAEWAADPWDEESQQPRTFRAWVDLTQKPYADVKAVAKDRAGNVASDSISFTVAGVSPTDTISPTLSVLSPLAGDWFTSTVIFSGTVADAESGVAAVEISLDGGFTWQPAAVDGVNWEFSWEAPEDKAYISYPAWVRASDQAGNTTVQARVFSIDNVPPTGPEVTSFKALIPFTGLEKDAPPGTHLDMPMDLKITWLSSFDGSGMVNALIAVDQMTDTSPTENLGAVTSTVRSLSGAGDWYVHLAVEDRVGNQFVRHYGPWHVGTFADLTTAFQNRAQTIVVDGQIDIDLALQEWHHVGREWGIFELMDDFSPADLLDWLGPQRQFVTWDGDDLFMGWQGAWWALDGDLWTYLNTRKGGSYQPIFPVPGCLTLPFEADYAVHITSRTEGTLYEWVGGSWQPSATDWDFAQGDSGGTEIRLALDMGSVTELGLISFALDDAGKPWAVFPTTNSLDALCTECYLWDWVTTDLNTLTAPNAGQPLGLDVLISFGSLQAPNGVWCPGSTLEYVVTVENLEETDIGLNDPSLALGITATTGLSFIDVAGATCADSGCVPSDGTWTLLLPTIEAGSSHTITITGQIDNDLGLAAVEAFGGLALWDSSTMTPVGSDMEKVGISHKIDTQPPTVQINTNAGQVIGRGQHTVTGIADDGTGGGVASVEYSVDGGATWNPAVGTTNWTASVIVPDGASTWEVRARATDACGHTSRQDVVTFDVDVNPPSVTFDPPRYVTGASAVLGGTTSDVEGNVTQVEVQLDDMGATWHTGQVYAANTQGVHDWRYTRGLPAEDCVEHTMRARVTDAAGNVALSGWSSFTVDNVPPTVPVTQTLTQVWQNDPADPMVLQGTASDGCSVNNLEIIIYTPGATAYRENVQWQGAYWQWAPDADNLDVGDYALRVEATDAAGNKTLEGPFNLGVKRNNPPIAVGDSATVAEGDTITVLDSGAASVMANDSDPENGTLAVTTVPVSGPSHGVLTLNSDGTFSYTHDGSETVSDGFTYQVCDDGIPSMCATAAVRITVTPVVDVPIIGLAAENDGPTLVGGATTLTATVDAGNQIKYTWAFGDGTCGYGRILSHVYSAVGMYTARVTATNDVSTMTATTMVKVNPAGELTTKVASPLICAGWNVGIDITYQNVMAEPPAEATLVISVPRGTQVVHAQSSPDLIDPGPWPGTVAWELGSLPKGATATYRLSLHLAATLDQGTVIMVPIAAHALGTDPIRSPATLRVRTDGPCQPQPPDPTATPSPTPAETPVGQQTAKLAADGDTTLAGSAPTISFSEQIFLTVNGTGSKRTLIHFGVDDIPGEAIVNKAWLELTTYAGGSSTGPLEIYAYEMLTPWTASEATWLIAQQDTAWAEPGADRPGSDRAAIPCAMTEVVDRDNIRYSWNVTDLVRRWVTDPSANYGLLLMAPKGMAARFSFWSSEASMPAAAKPHLRVSYTYNSPPGTPTVSATITRRPTQTPTYTPMPSKTPTGTRTPKPTVTPTVEQSEPKHVLWLPLVIK
jgi:VCBS repeat-containing protein